MFIYNPSGDSTVYDAKTSEAEISPVDDITIAVDTNIRTDYAKRGHHYQQTGATVITGASATVLTANDIYMIVRTGAAVDFSTIDENGVANTADLLLEYDGTTAVTMTYNDCLKWVGTPVVSGTLTADVTYMIVRQSLLDFTLEGAANSDLWTVFTASGGVLTLTAADSVIALTTWESTNFLDEDVWEDISCLTSPNEESYINADESIAQALVAYVKSKLVKDDVAMTKEHRKEFRSRADTGTTIRGGRKLRMYSPPSPFSLTDD